MDRAVITVVEESTGTALDVDIPRNIKVEYLINEIVSELAECYGVYFSYKDTVEMYCNGSLLDSNRTIAQLNIFDGSLLKIRKE